MTITHNMLSNNSVGNDWAVVYTYEGRPLTGCEQWSVPLDTEKRVIIEATVTENDKWPDVNSCFISVILTEGFETSNIITVVENKGCYKGNKALWEIACKVKLVDKLVQE